MQEIMKLAHEFLQNFCAGNQQNQALLHKHINLFLNPGVSSAGIQVYSKGLISTVGTVQFPKYRLAPLFPILSDPRGSHHAAHLHE